jgi:cobalt-zinc-cadmium efflux system membrane fusion protein
MKSIVRQPHGLLPAPGRPLRNAIESRTSASAIALLALLALSGCGQKEVKSVTAAASADPPQHSTAGLVLIPPDSPKLEQLRVEAVRTAEVPTGEVISPGKIEANPGAISRIVLPAPGRISSVLVKLGDAVEKGQTVLTLESPDVDAVESAYLQAGAALGQARANLAKAQSDFDRASDLFQHNAIAKKEVINSENSLAQSKAAVEQALASQEQYSRRIEMFGLKAGKFGQSVQVRAPLSGKVLELNVTAGEYRNDTNAPLMTIANLSSVWVSADVPESSIRLIQVGERVDVTLAAYPNEEFRARVMRIADMVDPQTRTIKVRAELENPRGRFRPEMFGSMRHTESIQVRPVVPVGAVIQGDGHCVVFVEKGPGRFQQTEIAVGKRTAEILPVLSGLKAGDRVVVDGAMLLKAQ